MAVLVTQYASKGGVAGESIVEGKAVVIQNSGLRNDLPTVRLAAVNDIRGVHIAFMPVDTFPSPQNAAWFTAPTSRTLRTERDNDYGDPQDTDTYYRIPRSMWKQPTVPSGELVAMYKGRIGITAGAMIDTANIRIPGNMVRVGASGLIEYTATASERIGVVDLYDDQNAVLYFTMDN